MVSKFLIITLLCIVSISIIHAQSVQSICTLESGSNKYNFAGFSNATNWQYVYSTGNNKMTYYWNVCNPASKCTGIATAAVCQYSTRLGYFIDAGDYNNVEIQALDPTVGTLGGKLVYYTSPGNPCKNGNNRKTTINMVCAPGMPNSIVSVQETAPGSCYYVIVLQGNSACPIGSTTSSSTTSGGSTTTTTGGGSTSSNTTTTTTTSTIINDGVTIGTTTVNTISTIITTTNVDGSISSSTNTITDGPVTSTIYINKTPINPTTTTSTSTTTLIDGKNTGTTIVTTSTVNGKTTFSTSTTNQFLTHLKDNTNDLLTDQTNMITATSDANKIDLGHTWILMFILISSIYFLNF